MASEVSIREKIRRSMFTRHHDELGEKWPKRKRSMGL